MLPFDIRFEPGVPIHRQVTYAIRKAIVAGELEPGARLPSVRALSQELSINPNTAHKVLANLTREGLLEVHPGIGTVVAARSPVSPRERRALLDEELERVVVEAKRLELELEDVLDAVEEHWGRLSRKRRAKRRTARQRRARG